MSDFEAQVKELAEKAVLQFLGSGNWVNISCESRVKIPASMLIEVWHMVNIESVKRQLAERIETELADRLVNHIAAEIATDIKQILSVKERREAVRAIARQHMDDLMKIGSN